MWGPCTGMQKWLGESYHSYFFTLFWPKMDEVYLNIAQYLDLVRLLHAWKSAWARNIIIIISLFKILCVYVSLVGTGTPITANAAVFFKNKTKHESFLKRLNKGIYVYRLGWS